MGDVWALTRELEQLATVTGLAFEVRWTLTPPLHWSCLRIHYPDGRVAYLACSGDSHDTAYANAARLCIAHVKTWLAPGQEP